MSMRDHLRTLEAITEKQGDAPLEIVSGGVYDADPEVVAFLADNDLYRQAVELAHTKAGDGEWVIVGVDVPETTAAALAGQFQRALKASRAARGESEHFQWSVLTTAGFTRGTLRVRFKANLWTDEQLRNRAQRLARTRQARHPARKAAPVVKKAARRRS